MPTMPRVNLSVAGRGSGRRPRRRPRTPSAVPHRRGAGRPAPRGTGPARRRVAGRRGARVAGHLRATARAAPRAGGDQPRPHSRGFYLMLMWHQHQPLYPKALHPEDGAGAYSRPWVRVHGDQGLSRHDGAGGRAPRRAAVFNLTPALLLQLEDLAARGAKDRYWVATEIPAARLTADDRRFLLERFFDVNPRVIARFRATGSWPTTAPAAASTRLWTRGRSRTSATCRCCSTSPGPIRTSWPPRLWRRWWSVAWAMPRRTRRPCWQSTGESSAR